MRSPLLSTLILALLFSSPALVGCDHGASSPDAGGDAGPDAHTDGDADADADTDVDADADADADATADADSSGDADAHGDADVDSGPLTPVTIWLIGDSTVAPDSGWGDALEALLAEEATVENRARGGRSSKSFYEEADNYWTAHSSAVMNHLAAGDYVLIQFGHNDEKDDVERHTEPGSPPDFDDTFRQYLELYIDEIEAVGATPILITPVSRMTFSSDGSHQRTHGDYPAAMIRTAELNGVVVLDLEDRSHEEFDLIGEAETVALYAGYDGDPSDRSHFPSEKAWRVAAMVVELLVASSSPLAAYCPSE